MSYAFQWPTDIHSCMIQPIVTISRKLSPGIRLCRSASAVTRNSVRPVRIALPSSNATVLVLDQVLVCETCSSRKVDSRGPQGVGACVLGGAESNGRVRVPAAQLRNAANDVYSLSKGGCAALVERDTRVGWGGTALTWGSRSGRAARPSGVSRGGAGAGSRAARAGRGSPHLQSC